MKIGYKASKDDKSYPIGTQDRVIDVPDPNPKASLETKTCFDNESAEIKIKNT
jgi:hypothetical protein